MLRVELPENSRIEYKFEVVRDGQEEWILDPLNPLHGRTTRSAPTRSAQGHGYERPEWTLPDPAARPGTVDEIALSERRARRRPPRGRVRAGALPAQPPLSAARRARRLRLPALREPAQTVLDNLIHRLEIPPLIVALTQSPRPARRVRGPRRRTRASSPRSCRRSSAHDFPLHPSPRGPRPDGRELRRGRLAARRVALPRRATAGCCCSRARSRSPTSATTGARRPSTRWRRFVNEFRRQPGPARRAHVPLAAASTSR